VLRSDVATGAGVFGLGTLYGREAASTSEAELVSTLRSYITLSLLLACIMLI
jgi:hypothetical protein